MNLHYTRLLWMASLLALISCRPSYGISTSLSFERETISGTIPVDDKDVPISNGVTKNYLLFIQTANNKPVPEWTVAWVNGKPFEIRPAEVKEDRLIGKMRDSGEDVWLRTKNGKQWWQLVLFPGKELTDSSLTAAIKDHKVLLCGRWKDKAFHYGVDQFEPLANLEMQ
jgi:hypothetical protein